MRKIMAISGEPGTGKTSLMRKFMEKYKWEELEGVKLVNALYNKELDLYILGKYEEGEVFAGTDKLGMNCQPFITEFVKNTNSNIIFEGDRLTNGKFFDFLYNIKNCNFKIIVLETCNSTLKERYSKRGSNQSETFLKGRKTKIDNIRKNMDYVELIEVYNNENLEEQSLILGKIQSFLSL